jgi:hypothetical protein
MQMLPQQPCSVFELLIASFNLYTKVFTKVIGYSLIIFIISGILIKNDLSIIFSIFDIRGLSNVEMRDTESLERVTALMQFGFLGITLVVMLLSCIFYSPIIYRIDNLVNKRKDNFVGALLRALKKCPSIILAVILFYVLAIIIVNILATGIIYILAATTGITPFMTVMSMFATPFLLIPSIILSFSLLFFWYFILLEDMGSYQSLKASHHLVWGQWWRTFLIFFIPLFFISIFIYPTLGFLISLFVRIINNYFLMRHFSDIIFALLTVFVIPYYFVLGYLQYLDLKLRKNI